MRLVTDDAAAVEIAAGLGVEVIADPGGGQGAAVQAALAGVEGTCLVVNADLPCATPAALARLEALAPALVAAADGTTNALALPEPAWFTPLYGSGSAARFAAAGLSSRLRSPSSSTTSTRSPTSSSSTISSGSPCRSADERTLC